jgi:small GTP-binding protein
MEPTGKTSCKVVLLGNSGVGKTSLVMQWTTGDYEAQSGPTIGANHQRKSVQVLGEMVDLFLWDTAGQEQFQALTPLYAHSSATAIIVVAIDDPESFKGISVWTELLNRSCDKQPPIVLLVNKIDKADGGAALSRETIKEQYAGTFAGLFFASAVSGEGVDAVFCHAGELAYQFATNTQNARREAKLGGDERKMHCC